MLSYSKFRISTLNRKSHIVLLAVDPHYTWPIGRYIERREYDIVYREQSNDGEINSSDKEKTERVI